MERAIEGMDGSTWDTFEAQALLPPARGFGGVVVSVACVIVDDVVPRRRRRSRRRGSVRRSRRRRPAIGPRPWSWNAAAAAPATAAAAAAAAVAAVRRPERRRCVAGSDLGSGPRWSCDGRGGAGAAVVDCALAQDNLKRSFRRAPRRLAVASSVSQNGRERISHLTSGPGPGHHGLIEIILVIHCHTIRIILGRS
jgi:hypothetical protein